MKAHAKHHLSKGQSVVTEAKVVVNCFEHKTRLIGHIFSSSTDKQTHNTNK